jgi:hypothetical protein
LVLLPIPRRRRVAAALDSGRRRQKMLGAAVGGRHSNVCVGEGLGRSAAASGHFRERLMRETLIDKFMDRVMG